ncbi:hypothetical protein BJY04DRAFT_212767 [Aspergillus karnatakaensis]|uniref:uncharacterized protein n=1 Tax=Aspergillus karnatakaensis TaxID=1810916 RepID=UPI003CCC9DD2
MARTGSNETNSPWIIGCEKPRTYTGSLGNTSRTLSMLYEAPSIANNLLDGVCNPPLEDDLSNAEDSGESSDSDLEGISAMIEESDVAYSELEDHLLNVHHAITSLYKFSVALANPARRDVSTKASKIDLRYYEPYDIGHVLNKFGLPSDSHLAQRLGKANTRRRQLLAYYKAHIEKISKYVDVFVERAYLAPRDAEPESAYPPLERPVSVPALDRSIRHDTHTAKSTEWTQNTTVSTVHITDLETASDTGRTVFSTTSSVAENVNLPISIPPPPTADPAAAQRTPFICSLCCQTITVKDVQDWEYHVYSDLQPYICTFGNCVQADRLYDSYTEWSEHERRFHRREWQCGFCTHRCESGAQFSVHIETSHRDLHLNDQLQSLTNVFERPATLPQQCPLCSKPPILDINRFQKHVARHLQQLALFAWLRGLPAPPNESQGGSSNSSLAVRQASEESTNQSLQVAQESLIRADGESVPSSQDKDTDLSHKHHQQASNPREVDIKDKYRGAGERQGLSSNASAQHLPVREKAEYSELSALERVRIELKAARVKCSLDAPQVFIPRMVLQFLVIDNVEQVLRQESIVDANDVSEVISTILEATAKIFAILVDVKKVEYIRPLLEERIHDINLPFKRARGNQISESAFLTNQDQPIQATKGWDQLTIASFDSKQYHVLSPLLKRGEHYELENIPLPFFNPPDKPNHGRLAKTGYRQDQQYIHREHYEFPGQDNMGVRISCGREEHVPESSIPQ